MIMNYYDIIFSLYSIVDSISWATYWDWWYEKTSSQIDLISTDLQNR